MESENRIQESIINNVDIIEESITEINENVTQEVTEEIIEEGNNEVVIEDITEENKFNEIQNDKNIETQPELVTGSVIPAHLNVRKEASKDSDIIGILTQDEEVKIISELEGFYKILFNGVEGFCVKDFISVK